MLCCSGRVQESEQFLLRSIRHIVLMSSSVLVTVSASPMFMPRLPLMKIQALKLVGVSRLFVVPNLRDSDYLSMLSSALPSLSDFTSHTISSEVLPELRSLVLVDNTTKDNRHFEAALAKMKCTINYREVFMWNRSTAEDKHIDELSQSMTKDDVINLQFTRLVIISLAKMYLIWPLVVPLGHRLVLPISLDSIKALIINIR